MNWVEIWAILMTISSIAGWARYFIARARWRKYLEEMRAFQTPHIPPGVLLGVVILAGLAIWKKEELARFLKDKISGAK